MIPRRSRPEQTGVIAAQAPERHRQGKTSQDGSARCGAVRDAGRRQIGRSGWWQGQGYRCQPRAERNSISNECGASGAEYSGRRFTPRCGRPLAAEGHVGDQLVRLSDFAPGLAWQRSCGTSRRGRTCLRCSERTNRLPACERGGN